MMDNTTILFNALQRRYRNAIVAFIREKLTNEFGSRSIDEVKSLFAKRNSETGKTYWDGIRAAAEERRSGGTGELSTPIRDEFELLGVEHFFTVFDKHFDVLCPSHAKKPKRERNQARQTLTTWMKQIKNVRDPLSHPVSDDIDYEDSAQVLYCARKTLDFCGLADSSTEILRLQSTLLGGFVGDVEKTFSVLPPEDEVVMGFIGRHRELAILNDWLSAGTSKRWALSGDGGKGKSAIAFAFARSVASREDHGLDAVLWVSAKRRRFIEGTTVLVDRPDFHDNQSAIEAIIRFFGNEPSEASETEALGLLSDFPSLLIVDDIDTVEDSGEDAIQFLLMTVPERTKSRVLITSRRALFGMGNLTTQIRGLTGGDGVEFIKSRCALMGIPSMPMLDSSDQILEVTDSSPLFIEDLLRLTQAGLSIEKAIGLWKDKRGDDARRYAIQREYEQLDDDAKQVLLALALQGPCNTDSLCRGLDWSDARLADAMQQLRKMFLMPSQRTSGSSHVLALNQNTQSLVIDVFRDTDMYRRTDRTMKAATGKLTTKRAEDRIVTAILRRAGILVKQYLPDDAEKETQAAIKKYLGRADLFASLAWIQKKKGDIASARMNFKRADELGCNQRDAYWHWSELETVAEEWNSAARVAEIGINKFGDSQGLLFRLGYALHRQGRELTKDGIDATKTCQHAKEVLEKARVLRDSEGRNYSLRHQIYRAIALNLEAMDDGPSIARHFAAWFSECPNDPNLNSEYERMRQRYPQYLTAR